MEQSQLVELIKTLTSEEKERVLQFAAIPFFNHGRMRAQVVPLLHICLNHPWNDPEQRLEKTDVFAALFPDQSFVEGKLEKVMVDAHKVVRSLLLTQHYFQKDNEFYQVLDFTEIVRLRGLDARYQQSIARLKKMQEDSPWRNAPHFHKQFLLESSIHYVECLHNQSKGDLNIPDLLHATETYYYLRRVALLSRYLLQLRVTKLNTPDSIKLQLEEDHIPERYLAESPQLKINFEIFKILRKDIPEASDIRFLLDLLRLHEKNLDDEALQEYYAYLRNFSILILTSNQENTEICYTLHDLYLDSLNRGYLHYEGKIPPNRYLAVSANAIKIKHFEWAREFIEKYKHDISGENDSQDIYRFNKAQYLFAIGQYSECLDYIPATSPFVDYLIIGKRLELKAYYELRSDLLSFKLDAFKMFLSRTSQKLLSDAQRQTNVYFSNLLTQITTSLPGDQKRADQVIKRIEETKQAAEWRWLLAKATALKEK
jgi:hypothetical protein